MNRQRIITFVLFFIVTQQVLVKASVNDLGTVLNDIYDNMYEKSSAEPEQKTADIEFNLIEQLLNNNNLDKSAETLGQKNKDNSEMEEKPSKAKKNINEEHQNPDCNPENKLLLNKLLRYAFRCDVFLRNNDLFNKRNVSYKNKLGQLSLKDFLTMRY